MQTYTLTCFMLMQPSCYGRKYIFYLLTSLLLDSNFLSSSFGFLLLPLSSLRQYNGKHQDSYIYVGILLAQARLKKLSLHAWEQG